MKGIIHGKEKLKEKYKEKSKEIFPLKNASLFFRRAAIRLENLRDRAFLHISELTDPGLAFAFEDPH